MSDTAAFLLVLMAVGAIYWMARRRDPVSISVRNWNAETKAWNADMRYIELVIERGPKHEAIKRVLDQHQCGREDYAVFCTFFQNLGMPPGSNRDKAMLSPEVLHYFLDNTHREAVNGKMSRVAKDEVAREVADRIALWVIQGTVPQPGSDG